jgi:hypothetical protein
MMICNLRALLDFFRPVAGFFRSRRLDDISLVWPIDSQLSDD